MTLDATLRPVAKQLVNSFGKTLTHRRVTGGSFDPSTGGMTGDTTTDTVIKGVVRTMDLGRSNNTLVQAGDMEVSVAALDLGFTPALNTDSIVIDSDVWAIVVIESKHGALR